MLVASVADFRDLAMKRLPRLLFDYIDGGSYSEETMRRNESDLQKVVLEQRVLRDVSEVSTATNLFGQSFSMPLIVGPVGLAGMYARRGEAQAARSAQEAGIPFCLSSVSICDLDEVKQAAGEPSWFQLYMIKDTGYMTELLAQARNLGCPALVFTVDLPVPALRLRDIRSGLAGQPGARREIVRAKDVLQHPAWLWDVWIRGRPHSFGNFAPGIADARSVNDFFGWVSRNYQSKITWRDLSWVRDRWPGPLVLKGILNCADAVAAAEAGVDAIVVSNHGGRQMNGASSTIASLPGIVQAINGRIPVLMDGGIRSGGDVLKALALGASACLIGRAWAFALAARGSSGVSELLAMFKSELETAMALSGCTNIVEANQALADSPFH